MSEPIEGKGKLLVPIANWRHNPDDEAYEITLSLPTAVLTDPATRVQFAKAIRPYADSLGQTFWAIWAANHPEEKR